MTDINLNVNYSDQLTPTPIYFSDVAHKPFVDDDDITIIASNCSSKSDDATATTASLSDDDSSSDDPPLPQINLLLGPNLAIADSGATAHFLLPNVELANKRPATNPLNITLPDGELEAAGWYDADNLPGSPSSSISIARQLIESFMQE